MSRKALFYSILAHLVLGALVFGGYRWHRANDLELTAPLGSVFVQEASIGGPRKAPPAGAAPVAPAPVAAGGESAENGEAPEGEEGTPGLPDGEAAPLGKIEPEYPPLARKLGEEGTAVFLLGIAEDGSVTSAVLEKSTGHARLDEAARKSLRDARFHPAVRDGMPTPSMKRFTVEFRLNRSL